MFEIQNLKNHINQLSNMNYNSSDDADPISSRREYRLERIDEHVDFSYLEN